MSQSSDVKRLTCVRDIETHWKHMRSEIQNYVGDVRGLVLRIRKYKPKNLFFADIWEPTGTIQIKFDISTLEQYRQIIEKLKERDRINVEGKIIESGHNNTLTLDASKVSVVINEGKVSDAEMPDIDNRGLTTQFMVARLRNIATQHMTDKKYVEFEPNYLSASRGTSPIEPLEVRFPGFGAKTFLASSPTSQLLTAILAANTQVFCISRVFSGRIRDGYTSAESMILCAMKFDPENLEMEYLSEDIIKKIFSDERTILFDYEKVWLSDAHWDTNFLNLDENNSRNIDCNVPTIQIFKNVEAARKISQKDMKTIISPFRIVWPPDVILAEGHTEKIDSIKIGGMTIHLERMVPLLKNVTLQHIRHTNPR